MDFLEWNGKTMGVGIKLIDDQHKELLKIINKLSTSINENSQRRDIVVIIDELIDYAAFHFTEEEGLFDKYCYEDKDTHKYEHALFVQKFRDIKDEVQNNEVHLRATAIEVAEDVFKYIIDWFINHVAGSDKKYIELFKKNGVE